ncbi:hemagglutinin repeat-containing protein [Neisseria lactamica]|uniref:Putative large surface adhesin n=2 Tax=Neisseria TaxID=482 RepID=E4ZCI4_NEIL0|nr:putative large surface adhesin [Neisseria lactamica 020-06]
MNKHRHKTVFNRTRGILMAVAETAIGQGKSPGERSGGETGGGDGSLKTRSGCRLHLGTLTFSLLLGFGSALIVPAAAADIQADKSAPKSQQPVILQTGNGLPQVNIQTPTAHGVSVNQYRRFDVDTRGTILNNSHKSVSTRQAGWIQGNPFLARGEARVIVNQINSSDPSRLNGYIEIAGRRAEVVMANPAGIRVDGGGFINSAGATLTTGRPILADGRFDGLDIGSGRIEIGAQGLDGRDADYTRILSRAAKIDGGIWGQDVQVIAAGGQTDAAGSLKDAAAPRAPSSSAPVFAIDTGALGGMYAGKITLIAADNGSGIRNTGKIYAGAGGVTLSADGTLANSGTVAAQDGGTLRLNAGQTDNSGTLYAHGQSSIDSTSSLNNSGRILSTSETRIRSAHIGNSGQIDGGRLDIAAPVLDNSGRISQSGSQDLAVDTARLANSGRIGLPENNNGNSGNSSGNNGGNNGNSGGNNGNSGANGNSGNKRPSANNGNGNSGNGSHTQVPPPADGRISVSGRLDNSGTIEAGGRTDLNVHSELANSGRLTLGSLKADGSRFDNRQGDILAHSADIHSSHSDNRGGGLAAGSLKLDGTRLDNRQGAIRSNSQSDIRLSDGLNNEQGEITTAGSLKLAAGDIAGGGSILAGQDLELTANRLDGSGTLAAGRDAALKLSADFDSSGNIEAGRKLSIESGGSIRNRHRLAGGAALDIRARHIDNRAEGKLVSGSNTRIGTDTVDNRGLINSNGLTRIDAATALNNIGSGRIYGSRLALGGGGLNNREEASADGKNQAPVIAARERLDIGMRSISNTGSGFGRIENGQVQTGSVSSLISSEGTLHIGGRLNERHQAEGRAERLENRGGRIEAAGDGVWSVAKIHNSNSRWEVNHKVAVGQAEHRHSYSQPGNPEWWQVGKDGSWRQTANHAKGEFTFNDGRAPVRQSSWNEKRVTIQRHEDQIAHSQPGQIAIGGNFTADTQELANQNGQILIGGVWQGSEKDSVLKNLSDLAGVYEIESGIFENSYARKSKSRQRWGRRTGYSAPVYNETLLERREFTNHISYQDQAGSLTPPAGHAAAADAATAAVAPQRIKSPDGSFSLPESSLYTVRPDRPGYLVETDPAYADYRTWLGSDYMLKALQTDPNRTHKRLGDGYYEQRLINEQIARLTGYRRLDGYPNDEAQFQALMDAGISFARTRQLTPGIALSPEQVARLTSDIVWLESQTVTLADGSSQSVLVPKVYVLARPGDLNSAGGLISADALQLEAGRIDNRGTLAGRRIVDLAAGDISNSGRIGGENVILDAQQQIDITGGSIEAERLLSLKADNITLQSSTAQSGDLHNGRTTVDRVAGLYVSGTEDGQGLLSLEAGRDIKLNGARLANRARDGHSQMIAREGSVTLGTVRTESHESYGTANDKNHRHVHQSAEAGSRIEALGNITVSAGRDLNIRQGQIDSQNGRTTLAARGNINISEGRRTLDLDESTYSKERGLVGSKSRLDQYRRQHDEAAGSVMTGREVRTASGGDTRIRGSQVISDDQTLIAAQGEVRIDAADNRYQDWENHERKKSGLTGSLRNGVAMVGYGKTQDNLQQNSVSSAVVSSQIGSLKGDTAIASGGKLTTEAAQLYAGGDLKLQGREVSLGEAYNRSERHSQEQRKQSGFSVGITYDPYTTGKNAWDKAMQGGGYSDSIVGNWMQRSSASAKASQAAGTPVVISGGRSRSTQVQDGSSAEAVGSSLSAGRHLSIRATEGSIEAKGAQISAEGDALLYARDDIRLPAAADSRRQTGSSKRSGFSIDNRDHITPFGTFNDQGQAAGEIGSISGSTLSVGGKTRLLAEKGNIAVSGSSLVSQDDLLLKAGGDIDIRAAEHRQSQSERQVSSGIGSAVISDTEHFSGWMKNRRESEGEETLQAKSQIGSLKGGVQIDAGGAYRQTGSDLAAARDIDISAQSVDIRTADNHGRSRQSERDLKIGTFAKISSPLIDLVNAAEGAAKSKADDRTRALQGLAAGAQAYQLADGVGKVADAVKNQTGQQGAVLLSVEAGFGFKTAGKEQNQNYRQSRESSLKAGGDINIRSREGDITVQGSNITAGDTIRLDSARDIRLLSAQDSQHQDGKNRNAGVQVGVGVSVGAQTGVYIYAEAAYGKGKNRSDSQTHQNTLLQSDKLQLSSKGNTVLNGAQAHARRIDADVGGTLYIESPQDTVEQESKQSGGGIRAQVALGTAWSVSGNYNQSKASGYSRSVGSQSGLFAGKGGYHITADSVRLKGGAIASAADKDHNELTARSFSFEDIRNESSYSAGSLGIGAGYGGSLKGSDGFNQSAFGRASQTAGQNMNKGFNYSPTLPQHESGNSQGYTRSLLSEGNITIGGKKTSARALGIHTDSATAHHGADSVPDLQNLLDKQQTVARSTAAIHSAVGTYRGNRAKAAAEELEKQQAAHEGRLKEQNDGSYEHYLSLSDAQRQQEMLAHSPAYAQAYQEARSWGVGGSKSRALSAAETLITGALGGQGDLQLAANTLAPYAAAAIGRRFGHGENKNEAAQAIGHFMLGAALAYANGADPLVGGSAAVAAERAAGYLAGQYDDGRTAIDPISGKFNPNLLPEHIKEEIKAQTGALASVVGAAGGSLNGTSGTNTNALFNAQVGGVLGQNAVENNNALDRLDGFTPGERSLRARADKIYQNNPKGKDLYIRSYEAYELEASYLAAKEIVVGTWEGIRHPWDNTIVPLAEAVSSPVQTVNKVVMSYENWKAVRDEAYINNPQLAGRMDAMFDARVGTNAAFMVVSGGTASAIVRSPAAAKVVNSAGNLSKIVRKAEAPSGKAVPVGEARIPQSPQAVKGTTVTLSQEQRLANGELIPKGSVVTWSDNAVKVVRPDGIKKIFNSKILEGSTASVYESKQLINSQQLISIWQNNPQSIWGLSAVRIAEHFNNAGYKATVRQSTQGSGKALIVKIEGHKTITQIQVHPGGGRHGGEYYKISTTDKGKIKIVNPKTYNKTNEKATILYK